MELFQNNLPVPEPTEEGPILVVTADCKGVPLVRSALQPEEAADALASSSGEPAPRQGREGEQEENGGGGCGLHDRSVCANGRRSDRRSHEGRRPPNAVPSPQHKRMRAELLVGKVALFLWLADEVIRRNPQGN